MPDSREPAPPERPRAAPRSTRPRRAKPRRSRGSRRGRGTPAGAGLRGGAAGRSVRFSGENPLFPERLTVAHHGERAVEPRAAHHAAPDEAAVLRAFGARFEAHAVAGRGRGIRAVAILVAVAGARAEAPVLEHDRVCVAFGLAALATYAAEVASVQNVHGRLGSVGVSFGVIDHSLEIAHHRGLVAHGPGIVTRRQQR